MSLKLIEGCLRGIQTYLASNLNAKLDALNTEYGDGLTLKHVDNTNDSFGHARGYLFSEQALESVQGLPIVYLLGEQTKVNNWNPSFTDSIHRVQVGVIASYQDYRNLRFFMYRYVRALWECLVEATAAGTMTSNSIRIQVDTGGEGMTFEFSPIFSRGSDYVADAALTFSVEVEELKP